MGSLQEDGIECAGVICDVTSETSLRAAADATIEHFDKVHMLVNSAG